MQVGRRGTRVAALVGVASLSLLVSACGGSNDAAPPTTRANSTTTASAPAATTTDPSATAVLQAYRASWSAFEHAAADANPDDPALAATMVDPQLTGVRANLLSDQQQGIVGRGTFTLHPKITALSVNAATVIDCAYSTAVLVYAKTGKQVPPITQPENDGVTSTLVLSSGTWKVAKQTVTDGKCAPGS
jgi:hypothetical protein